MPARRSPQRVPRSEKTRRGGGCLRGCVLTAALLLAIGLGLLWYADQRWEVIRPAPEVTHAKAAPAYDDLRFVVDPDALTRERLASLLSMGPAAEAPPAWLAQLFLPHEMAILAEVDYRQSVAEIALYLSERRGGPILKTALDEDPRAEGVPWMTWEAGGFERVRRGAMVMRGQAKLPMETMLEMSSRWLQTSAELEPLPLEGGHLAELLLDNRQGHAYAILDLLLRKQGVMAPATADELVASFEYVASCRLWGDVTAADAGLLGLRVTLREETREFAAEADEHLRVTSERLLGDLSDHLAERYAVDMRRLESGVDDGVYTARYEIAPLSGLFTQRRSGAARDRTRAPRPAEPPAT